MKKRLADLAHRRLAIMENIEAQRQDLADLAVQLQTPLALVGAGLKMASFIRGHPALAVCGTAALLAMRRTGVIGLALEGWRLLYLYPSILSFGSKFLPSAVRSPGKNLNSEIDL